MVAGTKRGAATGTVPTKTAPKAPAKSATKSAPKASAKPAASKARAGSVLAKRPGRVLLSSLRNEAPVLLEWVAYHRAIGFDRIVIAHNDCTDGSAELLAALEAIGWVTALDNPTPAGEAPQRMAAARLMASGALQEGDWAIWLDLDEFLNIHVGDRTLDALLERIGPAKALLIPWRLFGDSGMGGLPTRFVTEAFTMASTPGLEENRNIKTLFRHGPQIAALDIHRPTLAEGQPLGWDEALTATGNPIEPSYAPHQKWLAGMSTRNYTRMSGADFGWDLAQINHYSVRTRAYFHLKRLRGRGYAAAASATKRPRHTDELYDTLNQNVERDDSILAWQSPVTRLMAEAAADARVAAALDLVEARMTENAQLVAAAAEAAAAEDHGEDDGIERTPGKAAPIPSLVGGTDMDDTEVISQAGGEFRPVMWFPDEVRDFVQERYRAASFILEYGAGGSTVFAAGETDAQILSIESDRDWAAKIDLYLAQEGLARPGVQIRWIDIGPTGPWGKPTRPRDWGKFHQYPMQPWHDAGLDPDLVLIDGRFRLGCLVAAALHCRRPLTVLIDDYAGRPAYHRAETVFPLTQMIGHMAQFDLEPRAYSNAEFARMLPWFFTVE